MYNIRQQYKLKQWNSRHQRGKGKIRVTRWCKGKKGNG